MAWFTIARSSVVILAPRSHSTRSKTSAREFITEKGCAPRCTVACVHYTSYMDFWRAPPDDPVTPDRGRTETAPGSDRDAVVQLVSSGPLSADSQDFYARTNTPVPAGCAAFLGAAPKGEPKHPAQPAPGVKTPGIQIPFASLKAETEIPAAAKPEWLFFSQFLYVPDTQRQRRQDRREVWQASEPLPATPKPCAGMASAFSSLWVATCGDGSLLRFDGKTFKQTAKLAIGVDPVRGAIASTPDSIWMLTDTKTTLSRIDPDQNQVVSELRLPAGCSHLTFGETSLWVVCPNEDKLLRIDPATNLVTKRIEVSAGPQSVAIGEGSVWVLCRKDGKVERIDPKTDKVSKTIELSVPGAEGEIRTGDGSVWVTMSGFPLTRINPTTEKVAQQFHGAGGGAIETSAGAIWLSNVAQGTVWKIDPKRVNATLAE